jgi:2,3-bisphosphoglycerate-independent phosphoglycerate mutase
MGNSEVGHTNIGAGRIVYQSLTLIDHEIAQHKFSSNINLNKAINIVNTNNSTLHILGLLSDGGVHSHINHIIEIAKIAKQKGIKHILVHAFLDGRDVSPTSAEKYIKQLNEHNIQIASISGRYYSMDRDQR